MKLLIYSIFVLVSNFCHAQTVREIVDDACRDGAKLHGEFARINIIESYKILSETEPNSTERIVRLQKLESQLDEVIGRIKLRNRENQEEWVKRGGNGSIASLRRTALDSTIQLAINLAYKNPKWDLKRLILETQEQCEISAR